MDETALCEVVEVVEYLSSLNASAGLFCYESYCIFFGILIPIVLPHRLCKGHQLCLPMGEASARCGNK